jgi:periplasmic divalent cation tolerance protein
MKTRVELFNELEEALTSIHPYEVPEIIALPVVEGSESYLRWIEGETKK